MLGRCIGQLRAAFGHLRVLYQGVAQEHSEVRWFATQRFYERFKNAVEMLQESLNQKYLKEKHFSASQKIQNPETSRTLQGRRKNILETFGERYGNVSATLLF